MSCYSCFSCVSSPFCYLFNLCFVLENRNWLDIWNGILINVRDKCNGSVIELSVSQLMARRKIDFSFLVFFFFFQKKNSIGGIWNWWVTAQRWSGCQILGGSFPRWKHVTRVPFCKWSLSRLWGTQTDGLAGWQIIETRTWLATLLLRHLFDCYHTHLSPLPWRAARLLPTSAFLPWRKLPPRHLICFFQETYTKHPDRKTSSNPFFLLPCFFFNGYWCCCRNQSLSLSAFLFRKLASNDLVGVAVSSGPAR